MTAHLLDALIQTCTSDAPARASLVMKAAARWVLPSPLAPVRTVSPGPTGREASEPTSSPYPVSARTVAKSVMSGGIRPERTGQPPSGTDPVPEPPPALRSFMAARL